MRLDELSPKIYDLISTMLAQQTALAVVPIIEQYDNAPRPSNKVYIVFDPSVTSRRIGREIFYPATATEKVRHRQDYEITAVIREVGGYGQYLQLITNMQYNQTVMKYNHTNFLSILRIGEIVPTPRLLDDERWERESAMEMTLAISHIQTDETTYISDVEIINNIGV
jgi:hypothetical protein